MDDHVGRDDAQRAQPPSSGSPTLPARALPAHTLPTPSLPAPSLPARALPAHTLPAPSLPTPSLPARSPHLRLPRLSPAGHAVLRPAPFAVPPEEYLSLEYMPWKSGGDTDFAPLASARGDMECGGFWDHGKPDKDGAWTLNALRCPTLVAWVRSVRAAFGRVRVVRLFPQSYPQALRQLHQDDNNRLNPASEGWIVRAWLQLTHDPQSFMILRHHPEDAATEMRIPLPAGAQFVVDSERMFHSVCHTGDRPRHAVIASFESGPHLEAWISSQLPAAPPAPAPTRRLPARRTAGQPTTPLSPRRGHAA